MLGLPRKLDEEGGQRSEWELAVCFGLQSAEPAPVVVCQVQPSSWLVK